LADAQRSGEEEIGKPQRNGDAARAIYAHLHFPKNRLVRLEAQKGDIQRPGCDWKGVAKPTTTKVQWGVMMLVCTDSGWIRVEK
jgi:hypothetical protein